MEEPCKCLTIKLYDDAWQCMICGKPFAPVDWVKRTVTPDKTQIIDTGGGGWVVSAYALEIGGNTVTNVSAVAGENGIGVIDTGVANVVVSADVRVGSSANNSFAGIIAKGLLVDALAALDKIGD